MCDFKPNQKPTKRNRCYASLPESVKIPLQQEIQAKIKEEEDKAKEQEAKEIEDQMKHCKNNLKLSKVNNHG